AFRSFGRVLATASLLVSSIVSVGSADWRMFHADPSHAGSANVFGATDSSLAWRYVSSDSILYTSPVVGPNGTIYQANRAGELMAFLNNGFLFWKIHLPGSIRYSTPAIATNGTLYVG